MRVVGPASPAEEGRGGHQARVAATPGGAARRPGEPRATLARSMRIQAGVSVGQVLLDHRDLASITPTILLPIYMLQITHSLQLLSSIASALLCHTVGPAEVPPPYRRRRR